MWTKNKMNPEFKDYENVGAFLLQTTKVLNHLHISGGISPREENILDYIRNFEIRDHDFFTYNDCIIKDINVMMMDGSIQYFLETIFSKESENGKIRNINDLLDLINSVNFVKTHYQKFIIIILRNAEYLTDFGSPFLKTFFEVPLHTDLFIKFITVSKFSWHVISTRLGFKSSAMEVVLSPLNRSELLSNLVGSLEKNYGSYYKKGDLEKLIEMFLNVTYTYCADYNILLLMCKKSLDKIIEKNIEITGKKIKDVSEVNKIFSDILSFYYMGQGGKTTNSEKILLPTIAKYAIVASYCASFNPSSSDKRFFIKQHVKQRKTMHDVKRDPKNSLHELGPKNFTHDRFKMIFSYLLSRQNDINPLDVGTLDTLENLCNIGMLGRTLKQTNFEFPKYRSVLTKEFVEKVAESLDINLNDFLYDFASL